MLLIKAAHTYGTNANGDPLYSFSAADATWGKVQRKLENFRDQTGGQRMLDRSRTLEFLAQIRRDLASFGETNCAKS